MKITFSFNKKKRQKTNKQKNKNKYRLSDRIPYDVNVSVSVRSRLLVVKPSSMKQLVYNSAFYKTNGSPVKVFGVRSSTVTNIWITAVEHKNIN